MFAPLRVVHGAWSTAAGLLMIDPAPIAWARAEPVDGTEFVRGLGESILAQRGTTLASAADREERVRAIYRAHFDADWVSAQILGRSWREATDAQRREFVALFERYFAKVLVRRLSEVAGARVHVLMSEAEGTGVVVYSHLANARNGKFINLKWRLVKFGASYKVRDVAVESVSLVLHQKREFAPFASELDGAIAALRRRIAELERGR